MVERLRAATVACVLVVTACAGVSSTSVEDVQRLPAASLAVTVMTFWPPDSAMPLLRQSFVPLQAPLPPRLFDQLTDVTALLSEAEPAMFSWELPVE